MFSVKQIKANARYVLRRSYWPSMVIVLLMIAAAAVSSLITTMIGTGMRKLTGVSSFSFLYTDYFDYPSNVLSLAVYAVNFITNNTVYFFMMGPIWLGIDRFFIATREQQNPVSFGYLRYGFTGEYLKKSWANLSTALITWCWSIVIYIPVVIGTVLKHITNNDNFKMFIFLSPIFMIPWFIAQLRYSMVPYIIANNGNISGKRARELSTEMTTGHKMDLFLLELSFIGWIILGIFAFILGFLFVVPYVYAARAEAYTCLKTEIMQTKEITDKKELPSLIGKSV